MRDSSGLKNTHYIKLIKKTTDYRKKMFSY